MFVPLSAVLFMIAAGEGNGNQFSSVHRSSLETASKYSLLNIVYLSLSCSNYVNYVLKIVL